MKSSVQIITLSNITIDNNNNFLKGFTAISQKYNVFVLSLLQMALEPLIFQVTFINMSKDLMDSFIVIMAYNFYLQFLYFTVKFCIFILSYFFKTYKN